MADPISWIAAQVGNWVAGAIGNALFSAGVSKATVFAVAQVVNYGAQALVYIGAFAVTNALGATGIPPAEQGKTPVNSTTPWRQCGTGRARLSGKRAMWESLKGWNVEIVHLHEGPIDAFEQFWLNDDLVTIDADGWVQKLANGAYGDQKVRILTRRGLHSDTAFQEIIDICEDAGQASLYTSAHLGKGIAKVAVLCKAVDDKDVLKVYPNGPPLISVVARLSKVFDWRDPTQDVMTPSTWTWSQNAVVNHVHAEWCLSQLPVKMDGSGWIQGDGRAPPPEMLEAWTADWLPQLAALTTAADVCDEAVALAAGGTEPRYRQGGWWEMNVAPADLRGKFLDCYDGRMVECGDGAFSIQAGKYVEPTYALTDPFIRRATWNRGMPDKDKVNVLTATFASPPHGYSSQEAQSWRDEDSIARIGEKTRAVDLGWVNSYPQVRRLLKRQMARAGAPRNGDLAADFDGLNAMGHRYIRIQRRNGPASMRDVAVEIVAGSIDLAGGEVPLSVIAADPNVDAWNPLTEEGLAPALEERAPPVFAPMPVIVSAEAVEVTSGGGVGMRIKIVFEDPDRPGLVYSPRWRVAGATSWTEESPRPADDEGTDLSVTTGLVPDGTLEVSVAAWSGGAASDWPLAETVVVSGSADPVETALTAYLGAVTVQPNATRKGHMRTLISALIADGLWPTIDYLLIPAAHDSQAARVDWKHQRVATLMGAPVFTTDRQYAFDGVDDGFASGFTPSLHASAISVTSQALSVYERTNVASNGYAAGAKSSSNPALSICPRNTSDTRIGRVGGTDISQSSVTDSRGLTTIQRNGSTFEYFVNGVSTGTATPTGLATTLVARELYIGCRNNNGAADLFRACSPAAIVIHGAWTPTQCLAFAQALEAYLDAEGAGVV